ncbi:MAG: DUF262 domain-containing protein [Nitrospira sp.]
MNLDSDRPLFPNEEPSEEFGSGIEIEDSSGDELITKPFDPTLIRVESKQMTIDLLLTRINEKELDLTPDFQRKAGIWKEGAQSRLIESVLIRIPLPALYMDATDEDRWLVVDGLQRLTTLKRFVLDQNLRLKGLEFLTPYEGKTFDELPRHLRRRIKETQVTVFLIEKGTPESVKFNIFKRINTGGLPLSGQEIRHALNQGQVTEFLSRLATSDEFLKATDYGIRDDRMADRECVLRFLAFTLKPYDGYRHNDLDTFLHETMAEINHMSKKQLYELEEQFRHSMVSAYRCFGKEAFRKIHSNQSYRSPINKALFETWSVNLNKLNDTEMRELLQRKFELEKGFQQLLLDRNFDSAISQGTGGVKKVRTRFGMIENLVRSVLHD